MNVASSGSLRAISSASLRICAQTGSTFSRAPVVRTCSRAIFHLQHSFERELSTADRGAAYEDRTPYPLPVGRVTEARIECGGGFSTRPLATDAALREGGFETR